MKGRIAVAVLKIRYKSPGYREYEYIGAQRQITGVVSRIRDICKEFAEKEPDAMWIVGLPEHCFFNPPDPDSNSEYFERSPIALDDKNFMHAQMAALVKEFPQLTVIAGSVKVARPLVDEKSKSTTQKKLAQLDDYYKHHKKVGGGNLALEYKRVEQIRKKTAKKSEAEIKKDKNLKRMDLVSNTTYIYTAPPVDDKKEVAVKVIKHRKSSPYSETAPEDQLFRPASTKTHHPVYHLQHPVTKEDVVMGHEICMEHWMGVLCATAKEKPLIHFVASDHVDLSYNHIYGQYAIQADTRDAPRLVVTDEALLKNDNVRLYTRSLSSDAKLSKPLQPVFPVYFTVRDWFRVHRAEYKVVLDALNKIKNNFAQAESKSKASALGNLQKELFALALPKENKLFLLTKNLLEMEKAKPKPDYKSFLEKRIKVLEKEQRALEAIYLGLPTTELQGDVFEYARKYLNEILLPPTWFFGLFSSAVQDRSNEKLFLTAKEILKQMDDHGKAPALDKKQDDLDGIQLRLK